MIIAISVFLSVLLSVLLVADVIFYLNAPYKVRAWHWWSWFPFSGFYAQYKAAQQKLHPTSGESAASDSESNLAPKRVI